MQERSSLSQLADEYALVHNQWLKYSDRLALENSKDVNRELLDKVFYYSELSCSIRACIVFEVMMMNGYASHETKRYFKMCE